MVGWHGSSSLALRLSHTPVRPAAEAARAMSSLSPTYSTVFGLDAQALARQLEGPGIRLGCADLAGGQHRFEVGREARAAELDRLL